MSGGSYNYNYSTIENEYAGKMFDPILNEMMKDLVEVLHDLEWWQSGDYCEEDYRITAREFKEKYFKNYNETIKEVIKNEVKEILRRVDIDL